jgi:OOP family OmpA-OmpF porin
MIRLICVTKRFGTNRASQSAGVLCPGVPRYPSQDPFDGTSRYTRREEGEIHLTTQMRRLTQISGCAAGALALLLTSGCSTKKYVKGQTAPLIQHTNELDDQTATNNRNLKNLDEKTTTGIGKAQSSADSAQQNAQQANTASSAAQQHAQEAVNRADSLASVVSNLDSYKQIAAASVTFGFDKSVLTRKDKDQLDQLATPLNSTKGYILEVTGGTDSVGSAEYNYDLSQRRAEAVVQYLASKYNVPAHKFYLIGIGKDKEVASNKTAAGRAQNRRVDIQVLSNMQQGNATVSEVQSH